MEYRGYEIESSDFGMKVIKPTGRGSVHKSLRGSYTKPEFAVLAIDKYEDTKVKGKADGEAKSTG